MMRPCLKNQQANTAPTKKRKPRNNKWWQGCGEIGALWECKMMQSLRKTAWQFLKK
jgi:hypothetical protein